MLGFLFGFNARIGRLHYFLGLFGLGFVIAVMFYVVTGVALPSTNRRPSLEPSAYTLAGCTIIQGLLGNQEL